MDNNWTTQTERDEKLTQNAGARNQQRLESVTEALIEETEKKINGTLERKNSITETLVSVAAQREVGKHRETVQKRWDTRNKHRTEKEKLTEQLYTDALTGIQNKGAFDRKMDSMIASASIEEQRNINKLWEKSWLVLIDFDHFKSVNDTQGHGRGDEVLQAITHMISRRLRKSDFFARIWGDEFAIIVDDATQEDILKLSWVLRKRIEANLNPKLKDVPVTLSIGIAPFFGNDISEVKRKADEALYVSKWDTGFIEKHGFKVNWAIETQRNSVSIYDPETHSYKKL